MGRSKCRANRHLTWEIMDHTMFLFPRTWYGLYRVMVESPFLQIDSAAMMSSFMRLLLPFAVIGLLNTCCLSRHASIPFLPAMASPWAIHSMCTAVPYVKKISQQLAKFQAGRFTALPSAIDTIEQRVQVRRLQRSRRFDIYLPTGFDEHRAHQNGESMGEHGSTISPILLTPTEIVDAEGGADAILLIPGALVPHAAYAEVAARLSDAGSVVVVASFEPTRLAHRHLGADSRSIRRIMTKTQAAVGKSSLRWTMLGHSMGTFAACELWTKFDCVDRIVLWGMGAFPSITADLTAATKSPKLLMIQGTNDAMVKYGLAMGWQKAFDSLFPTETTQRFWIEGGTHDGFASYDESEHLQKQTSSSPPSSVHIEQRRRQQNLACNVTSTFILEEKIVQQRIDSRRLKRGKEKRGKMK